MHTYKHTRKIYLTPELRVLIPTHTFSRCFPGSDTQMLPCCQSPPHASSRPPPRHPIVTPQNQCRLYKYVAPSSLRKSFTKPGRERVDRIARVACRPLAPSWGRFCQTATAPVRTWRSFQSSSFGWKREWARVGVLGVGISGKIGKPF